MKKKKKPLLEREQKTNEAQSLFLSNKMSGPSVGLWLHRYHETHPSHDKILGPKNPVLDLAQEKKKKKIAVWNHIAYIQWGSVQSNLHEGSLPKVLVYGSEEFVDEITTTVLGRQAKSLLSLHREFMLQRFCK